MARNRARALRRVTDLFVRGKAVRAFESTSTSEDDVWIWVAKPNTFERAEAIKDAYKFAFNAPCSFTREGGSIGAVKTMEDVLGAPVHFLGLSLPSHGYHAPNENYDWEQASGGMAMFARFFESAGRIGKSRDGNPGRITH